MDTQLLDKILQLPADERLDLLGTVWDSLAVHPDAVPMSEEESRIVDQRLADLQRDGSKGSPWREVRQRIEDR